MVCSSPLETSVTMPRNSSICPAVAINQEVGVTEQDEQAAVGCTLNAGEISIEISRAPIEEESVPMDRFTKDRFPGLFR